MVNGKEVFGRKVPKDNVGPERFVGQEWDNGGNAAMPAETFKLKAGDVVDFAVGSRGEYTFDSTSFNAVVCKVPTVTIPNAEPVSFTVEGADLNLPVQVQSDRPITGVALLIDGETVDKDETAPYNLKFSNIRSGTHYLTVAAEDEKGIQNVSAQLKLFVLKNGEAAARRAQTSGIASFGESGNIAAAATSGTSYFCSQSGSWSNPATWGGTGVPGRNDDATIAEGFAVNVSNRVEVQNLEASGSVVIGVPGSPDTLVVYGLAQVNGEIQGGDPSSQLIVFNKLSCLASVASFRDLSLIVSGEVVVTDGGSIRSSNCNISTSGSTKLFSPPGTNRPVVVAADQVDVSGGRLALDSNAILIARAGLIGQDGASLIGQDGASLIGQDGASLIGQDGASLIGQDGASLIGPDGASLIGLDGASLIGQDGASLIGQDGASLITDNGAGLVGPMAAADATVQVAEASDFGGITLESGTVSGTINLIGNVLNRGAFIAPGNSAGKVKVSGNYTQEAAGTLLLEVGGTGTDPLQFDQLQINGTANLDGNLIVKTINGFTPQSDDSFAPLTYGSVNGNFAKVSSNAQVSFGANGVTLVVAGPNPPAPKALNISTRMRVGTGDNALIAGFIITGSQPKKVIIRGVGPSLPVTGALTDTTLELDGGAVVNDNWRSDQEAAIKASGVAPSSDKESAIVATLEPGQHTAILRGQGNTTGVGLVEVYDLEAGKPAQLANISTRGLVQTGDGVMIGGFIIGGDYPAKVLLRAIGPSLPLKGTLKDPVLELVDADGNIISNDNWRSTQEAEIAGTGVPPTNEKEAAIVATLVPGNYTAIVRGRDGTTGVALVEGYNLQ